MHDIKTVNVKNSHWRVEAAVGIHLRRGRQEVGLGKGLSEQLESRVKQSIFLLPSPSHSFFLSFCLLLFLLFLFSPCLPSFLPSSSLAREVLYHRVTSLPYFNFEARSCARQTLNLCSSCLRLQSSWDHRFVSQQVEQNEGGFECKCQNTISWAI